MDIETCVRHGRMPHEDEGKDGVLYQCQDIKKSGVVAHSSNPSTGRLRHEDELQALLYIDSTSKKRRK